MGLDLIHYICSLHINGHKSMTVLPGSKWAAPLGIQKSCGCDLWEVRFPIDGERSNPQGEGQRITLPDGIRRVVEMKDRRWRCDLPEHLWMEMEIRNGLKVRLNRESMVEAHKYPSVAIASRV